MKKLKSNKAFTLVELIVTIVVSSILLLIVSSMSISSLKTYNNMLSDEQSVDSILMIDTYVKRIVNNANANQKNISLVDGVITSTNNEELTIDTVNNKLIYDSDTSSSENQLSIYQITASTVTITLNNHLLSVNITQNDRNYQKYYYCLNKGE